MFSLRRVFLPHVPSTSSRTTWLLDFRGFASEGGRAGPDHFERNLNKFVHVATTGYSFVDPNGKRVAKYGIYWGKDDARNGIRTLSDGQSSVAAMLTAILEAINVAREEEPPPPLLIYSDLTSCESLLRDLSVWAKRDFYKRNSDELMRNSQLLHDLFVAVQGLHLKIVHRVTVTPENQKNLVTTAILEEAERKINEKQEERKRELEGSMEQFCSVDNVVDPAARMEVVDGTVMDKDGKTVTGNVEWPIVYVAARCTERDNFVSGGYCTYWPGGQAAGGRSFRFVPFPVTLFRAELAAVEEALKQAVDEDIQHLTVVISSAHFMNGWRSRWIGTVGEQKKTYSGKAFFERICDLCARLKEVHFRYQKEEYSTDIEKELEKRCTQGLSYALVGKDKSEYELELDDLVTEKMDRREGVPVVRLFKTGTKFNAGFVWQGDEQPVSGCGTPGVLIRILESAVARGDEVIVIRADSERLIKTFAARMEIWRRNGWRNSQHKRIAKWAEWEKAWKLKQKVHVIWEYMETADEEDRKENQRIPVYIRQ